MKRRGILAAAAAIVAGIAAKSVAEPVSANNGDSLLLGQAFTTNNRFTLPTGIEYLGSTLTAPNSSIFEVADQTYPLVAGNTVAAIAGAATSAVPNGVYGFTQVNGGAGVVGVGWTAIGGQSATGVQGISSGGGSAVLGQSGGTGPGVYGGTASGNSNNVNGVEGHGGGTTGTGVVGIAAGGANSTPGTVRAGVYGNAQGSGTGPGIWGIGNDIGARGDAANSNGVGVFGTTDPFTVPVAGPIGVFGRANALGGVGTWGEALNGVGAYGHSNESSGVAGLSSIGSGVYGQSANGIGVYGTSVGNYGVLGVRAGVGFAGITGITSTANVAAFAGGSTTPSALAARFNGGVYVDCTTVGVGQFVVNPMSAKFGTVQHADGSLRLMASMEAPESWAVDVGEGQLVNGHAEVKFDPDFASVIEGKGYRIVLTPLGDCKGLYATDRGDAGFAVHELQGGTGALGFTWVVYAHPRAQKSERLKKFVAPVPLKLELPKALKP